MAVTALWGQPLATTALFLLGAGRVAIAQPSSPTVAIISPDARLVAAQRGREIRVWDRATGRLRGRVDGDLRFRGAVAGDALAAVTDEGIVVHRGPHLAKKLLLASSKSLAMGRVALSADGRVAAAAFPGRGGAADPDTVGVWDAVSGKRVVVIGLKRGHRGGRILGLALSPDGRRLAIFGDAPNKPSKLVPQRTTALLEVYLLTGKLPRCEVNWSEPADHTAYSATFSPDGRLLALGAGARLLLWKVGQKMALDTAAINSIQRLFPTALRNLGVKVSSAHQVAFSPDGKELASMHGFGVVGVARWSTAPRLVPQAWIKRPRDRTHLRQISWDPKGVLWLITSGQAPEVLVHHPGGGRFSPARVLRLHHERPRGRSRGRR